MAKFKSKATSQLSGGCLSLFGLPFLAAGLFLTGLCFHGYSEWWRSRNWVEVPCWIESAELESHDGDDSTTYKAVATYRYEFNGHLYQGDRVTFGKGADNIGDFQQQAHRELARHVVGKAKGAEDAGRNGDRKPFRCYVNPAKPDESILYRVLRWQMQAFMAIFALTFPAVGAGLVAGGILAVRAAGKEKALVTNHPDEPWRWKTIWAQPAIPEEAGQWKLPLYLYTIWSGLIIVPMIVTATLNGAFQTSPWAWLLLIFVALWGLVASASLKRLRQWLAIGSPGFEMSHTPASPGGMLEGSVIFKRPPPSRGDAELSLVCEKKTTHSTSDGDSTSTEKVWSHTDHVPMDQVTRDVSGFRLPISIALPPDAPESEAGGDSMVKHVWKLQLKVAGTAISPVFEVPVFHTEASAAMATATVPSIRETIDWDLPRLLAGGKLQVDFDSNGFPKSIVCPPARHRGLIVFLIIFDLIWTAAAIFLIHKQAPLVFRIVWPVSAAGIWLIVLYQLLHSRRVLFDGLGLEILNHVGPWTRTAKFAKFQITGFSHDTNMSSNNTNFYRVRLEDVLGKKTTVADGITESSTAVALAGRLDEWRKSGQ